MSIEQKRTCKSLAFPSYCLCLSRPALENRKRKCARRFSLCRSFSLFYPLFHSLSRTRRSSDAMKVWTRHSWCFSVAQHTYAAETEMMFFNSARWQVPEQVQLFTFSLLHFLCNDVVGDATQRRNDNGDSCNCNIRIKAAGWKSKPDCQTDTNMGGAKNAIKANKERKYEEWNAE